MDIKLALYVLFLFFNVIDNHFLLRYYNNRMIPNPAEDPLPVGVDSDPPNAEWLALARIDYCCDKVAHQQPEIGGHPYPPRPHSPMRTPQRGGGSTLPPDCRDAPRASSWIPARGREAFSAEFRRSVANRPHHQVACRPGMWLGDASSIPITKQLCRRFTCLTSRG